MNSGFTQEKVDKLADLLLIGLTDEENKMVFEEFEVIDANINKINEIENSEFFVGDVEKVLPELIKQRKLSADVAFIDPPKWYEKKTSTNRLTSEIFIDEGENYLHMTYTGCDYNKCNLKCKFCGCGERVNDSTPDEIAEVVDFAKDERKYHVCLGGGTYLPLPRSTANFINIIDKIRKKSNFLF